MRESDSVRRFGSGRGGLRSEDGPLLTARRREGSVELRFAAAALRVTGRDEPPGEIRRPARRRGHQQPDRLRGPVLRLRARRKAQRHAEHQQKEIKAEASANGLCTIDDFMKVDLRIARIANAEHVEGADKLVRLTLDIGNNETRNVFAGIKSAYDPEQLKGRLTVMVANLQPRKMRFGESQGMVLAASGVCFGLAATMRTEALVYAFVALFVSGFLYVGLEKKL